MQLKQKYELNAIGNPILWLEWRKETHSSGAVSKAMQAFGFPIICLKI